MWWRLVVEPAQPYGTEGRDEVLGHVVVVARERGGFQRPGLLGKPVVLQNGFTGADLGFVG